jgi:trk system potassium uptake protein TrkA
MRIVVLGGGTVGTSISALLCKHGHSVTVVDSNPDHVRLINETLDVRALTGYASQSSALFQAGVLGADLCLAVTGDDEANLVGASMAKAMGSRRTVARVYAPVFRDLSTFDYQRHFDIDRLLSMEHLSAIELARGIRQPGSVSVENLARGQLEVQEFEVAAGSTTIDKALRELGLPKGVRIGSISRNGKIGIAGADDRVEVGDRITLIGERQEVDKVKSQFRMAPGARLGVVIAGGGETGYHLARALEGANFAVVLMEANRERCEFLAGSLQSTTVVHRDATRRANLEEERVGAADVFVATMGEDENNIMAGVEAREIGAKKISALVSRPDYANVVAKLGIDHTVSPRNVIARQVLGFLNTGPLVSRTMLGDGGMFVLEIDVLEGAAATEHVLANLELPPQCLIAAVVHSEYARVPGADDRLTPGDTVVALVAEEAVDETLRVFHANG